MAFNQMVQGSLPVSPTATCATENMNIKQTVTHQFFFTIYLNLQNFETCTDNTLGDISKLYIILKKLAANHYLFRWYIWSYRVISNYSGQTNNINPQAKLTISMEDAYEFTMEGPPTPQLYLLPLPAHTHGAERGWEGDDWGGSRIEHKGPARSSSRDQLGKMLLYWRGKGPNVSPK